MSEVPGRDKYDRNPFPTVDAIIEHQGGVVLIERKNKPFGWALPGGFVDYGESMSAAVVREVKEETSLQVELLEQFHTYSDPARDPRKHAVSTVFLARSTGGTLEAGDDAKGARVFHENDLPQLVFDHAQILADYFRYRRDGKRPGPTR